VALAAAYDVARLLQAAARAHGPTCRGIQRDFDTLGRDGGAPAFGGATGDIRFDAHGDPLQKAFAVGVISNGTIQLNRGSTR
jgi:ABC-type branched-subunit amino acid transport system substrate-binding protein